MIKIDIPVEYTTSTEMLPDKTYDIKISAKLNPIPIISIGTALLTDAMNAGESNLRKEAANAGYDVEIFSKEGGWVWEIPNISVNEVWFKYRLKLIPKPGVTTKVIPVIPILIIGGILIVLAVFAYLIIKFVVAIVPLIGPIVTTVGFSTILIIAALGAFVVYEMYTRAKQQRLLPGAYRAGKEIAGGAYRVGKAGIGKFISG